MRAFWIDAFRGCTLVLTVITNALKFSDKCSLAPSPWTGITAADLIEPLFLYISAVSLMRSRPSLTRHAKLLIIGLIVTQFASSTFRIPGALQRLSLATLPLTIILLRGPASFPDHCYRAIFVLGTLYLRAVYHYHTCAAETQVYDPFCNAAAAVDRAVFGSKHISSDAPYQRLQVCSLEPPCYFVNPLAPMQCYKPFDVYGLLGTLNAAVMVLFSALFSHPLTSTFFKKFVVSTIFYWIAFVLHETKLSPIIPAMFTTSFLLLATSFSVFIAALSEMLCSLALFRFILWPFAVVGSNGLIMHLVGLSGALEFALDSTPLHLFRNAVPSIENLAYRLAEGKHAAADLNYAIFKIALMFLLSLWLHRRKPRVWMTDMSQRLSQ